jgi:hypothetical protein
MNTEYSIHITIQYKLESNNWVTIELNPDEYFELEPDEKVELDSVPRYNHAIEYLDVEQHQILATKITLIDEQIKAKLSIIERFWNQGKNRLIERTEIGPNPYWEIILEIQANQEPPLWEIIRLGRENGIVTPSYHGLIQDNDDGSQTETVIETTSLADNSDELFAKIEY